MTDARTTALRHFVATHWPQADMRIDAASADASFRRYWRASANGETRIVMDAPPDKENLAPWLDIGARLRAAGLHAPRVDAVDSAQGFILMEDLGDRTCLPALDATSADALYGAALDALFAMQTRVSPAGLPVFDAAFLRMELDLMPAWFLERHLGVTPNARERAILDAAFAHLTDNALAQPQTFMHRDFHSRNLMLPAAGDLGVIDFQGAMLGALTYDLASLLRDCYIAWPEDRIEGWMQAYRARLADAGATDASPAQFRRWFDLTGLQRHVKVLGIFCRLNYRDGKPGYLADLPLTFRYVVAVARRYPELAGLAALLERALGDRDVRAAATGTPARCAP